MTDTVEYLVYDEGRQLIRSHRWEPTGGGTVHSTLREWAWNYRTESYNDDRHTFDFDVTPEGIVEHDGRSLEEYARSRVDTLTGKRGVRNPTVRRVA